MIAGEPHKGQAPYATLNDVVAIPKIEGKYEFKS